LKTILIVDDDAQLRLLIVEFLESIGYSTIEANTGQAALEILPNREVDLVICDIRMPIMSGVKFLETVKVVSPKPPIVMITGYAPSPRQRLSIKAMADEFIAKPFTLKKLAEVVQSQFNKS